MRDSSKLQGMIIHPVILALKYNLNFLKGSFIPSRQLSEGGGSSGASFFSFVVNFERAFYVGLSYN